MFGKKINIELVSFVSKFYVILKNSSHLDLSMQSYELLKLELQNCINSKVKRKRQKLYCNFKIWIVTPNIL